MAIDYSLVLEDLEQRRAELDVAIAAIRKFVGVTAEAPVVISRTDSLSPTLPDKIVAFLDEHASRMYSPDEIAATIGAKAKAVRAALSRISAGKKPRVQKVGRGRYASLNYREGALFRTADNMEGE